MVRRNRKQLDKAVSKKRKQSSDARKKAKRPRGKWITITSSSATFFDTRNPVSSDVLFQHIDRIDTLFALAKFHSALEDQTDQGTDNDESEEEYICSPEELEGLQDELQEPDDEHTDINIS